MSTVFQFAIRRTFPPRDRKGRCSPAGPRIAVAIRLAARPRTERRQAARFPRFVHGAGPRTNRRRGGRRVGNATPPLERGDGFRRPPRRPFGRIETGDVPSDGIGAVVATTGAPAELEEAMSLPNLLPFINVATGAPSRIERGDVPQRTWTGRTPRSERGFPTTRPRVSHRLPTAAVLVWGIASCGQPVENAPCLGPAPSRTREPRARLGPSRVSTPCSAGSAFSTLRPRRRFPRKTRRGGRREGNATPSVERGDGFRRPPRRPFGRIETGDVPFRRHLYRRRSHRRACRIGRGDVLPNLLPFINVDTDAPPELKGAMFPNGRGRPDPALRARFPDDPAPRFPPPAHRRCA